MSKIITNFLFVCGEIWKSIGIAQRVSILLVAVLGLGALAGIVYMGTRPNWQVLYSRLDAETASKIYELARDENVQVQLKDSGRTILVPYEQINALRLKAAKAGLPKTESGTGLEIFDNVKIGMTEMQQQVGYQRAIQGEIQRMLRKMPGIADANVVLVLPAKRLFRSNDETRRKASVMVVLQPGTILEGRQVGAIRSLVAATVEGMSPEDVTVTDSSGRLLARGKGLDVAGGGDADSLLETRERIEASLREKAEAILRPITGENAVVAIVSADLDFSGSEKTSELFDSEKAVIVSEKITTDDSNKSARRIEGVTGTASNIVSVRSPTAPPGGDASQQTRKMVENQYLVPKTVERTSMRGPRLKGLSVAVSLQRATEGKSRAPEELDSLRKLVMSAVGAVTSTDGSRNDSVIVVEQDFPKPAALPSSVLPIASPTERLLDNMERLLPPALLRPVLGAVMLITLYFVFGAVFRREQVERFELNSRMAGDNFVDVTAEAVPAAAIDAKNVSLELVKAKTDTNPELVAGVLRAWMSAPKA